jgi:hypothetical protein
VSERAPGGAEPSERRRAALWVEALARGAIAFALVLALGELLALAVWAFGGTGISLAAALGAGWLEVGTFHHVAIRIEIRDLVTPAQSSITLTIGIALLAATVFVCWLLGHAGRAVGEVGGGSGGARALRGALVGVGYAMPFAILTPFVAVETARPSAAVASGVFRLALVAWQAVMFPLAIGVTSGALGGLRSAVDAMPESQRRARLEAAGAGGLRMLVLAFVLVFAGLFVGGIVRPDDPIALATPTTARYVRAVLDRPAAGLVLLGHHLALSPAEAAWVVVPAMGGCDRVTGSVEADILCYGRFPEQVGTTETPISSSESVQLPLGRSTYGTAPAGYFLFLLVPALASVLGGVRAGRGAPSRGEAIGRGALAGVVFAMGAGLAAVAAIVTIGYRSSLAGDLTQGWIAIGPDPMVGFALALGWGVTGGAIGAAVSSRRPSSRS